MKSEKVPYVLYWNPGLVAYLLDSASHKTHPLVKILYLKGNMKLSLGSDLKKQNSTCMVSKVVLLPKTCIFRKSSWTSSNLKSTSTHFRLGHLVVHQLIYLFILHGAAVFEQMTRGCVIRVWIAELVNHMRLLRHLFKGCMCLFNFPLLRLSPNIAVLAVGLLVTYLLH